MDFDGKVWPLAGGFGRYTRLVAAASWLPNVCVSLGFFSEFLYTSSPESQCQGGPCGGDNSSSPGATLINSSTCPGAWGVQAQSWLHGTIVTQWHLVCENGWKVPLEQICYLIGWLWGYIIFGLVCDRFGRRNGFISALVVALPLGVALCFSPGYLSFMAIRIVFGAALSGIFLSFYIARLELCPPGLRLMITMIGGFFWLGGELLLPGVAVLCSDWKVLQGAISGALLLLSGYWCCHLLFPESPRWLLATRQLNRCKAELCLFSRANGIDTGEDFAEIDSLWRGFPRPRYYSFCSLVGTRLIWRNALILGFTTGSGLGIILGLSMLGRASFPMIVLQQRSGFFLHHVVFSSFCILSVLSLLLLPETKRKALPDTLRQGEGLRRPPLLLQATQDAVPLLSHGKPRADYNPDSYAQLASSTKKMIRSNSTHGQDNKALTND
ncbi:hypothetical protein GDO81_015907 [Engystomops pustulosus]|uniref:Solute carrier family 22 member 17 n=1 Tax=Engystomops pustulosus TaxID=76066 RepID=A0AAV7AU25_ENGPU|nr:hypothetical protein GDO81_015907 [Engystomops pustulosus]